MSEAIKDGGPAFPFVEPSTECSVSTGMTLRDYFAAKAMQGFCAYGALSNPDHGHTIDDVAQDAYDAADAMLKARESA
jgi:hypothetical protein